MTDTYIVPGINVFKCPLCSRKGNNIFIPVTLKRFNAVMLYGSYNAPGVCKACGKTSLVELARPNHPVPDAKRLSEVIKKLLSR